MADENDVNVRQKHLLQVLRNEGKDSAERSTRVSDRHVESSNNGNERATPATDGRNRETLTSDQRANGTAQRERTDSSTPYGPGERVRQVNGTGVNASKGSDRSSRGSKEPVKEQEPPRVNFVLKNPFKRQPTGPVKLFSKEEAEAEYDKLYSVYFQGSGILDDILEIVVKGHEPVSIWQLLPDEADMLTTMHLERARFDESAARSARQMLALYDRIYQYVIILPRVKDTYVHVKEHEGFSFR